jgi:DNA-binding beta-propeller fold protein YncE
VADTANSRLVKFDSEGKLLAAWSQGRTPEGQAPPAPNTFIEPWGVAVDSEGNVYVADTWNHRVQKFDAQGQFLLEWGAPGVAADGPDRFWGPRGIAISPDGQVYVTDTGNRRVVVFDGNGRFLFEFGGEGEAGLNEPVGLALGPEGQVYVADTWNGRVAVFSEAGEFMRSWPVQAWAGESLDNKPYLAVDSRGQVYVTDPEGYRVIVFSNDGQPLGTFGQYGPEPDAFGLPVGIVIGLDDSVWVSDAGNNRLARFAAWQP